jgi:GntR family transcriptional repressor for pyruvate dehydrogenase complex
VAGELLHKIAAGDWEPGDVIPAEAELATASGVGRSTLREAVKTLVGVGVLEIRRGRGTYVRPLEDWSPFDPLVLAARSGNGQDTTQQVLEARKLVEAGVAELAATRATPADLAKMDGALERMRQAADLDAFVSADLAFHQALMDAAGNQYVAALLQPIEALLREERRGTSYEPTLRRGAIAAHQRIARAVHRGDAAGARRAMVAHIEETARKMARRRSADSPGS